VSLQSGLIGYGFIASQGHAPVYAAREDFEIVAIADICAARRQAAAADFPNARIYSSHQELLAHEAERLDLIDITTPPYAHAEIAKAAFEHGLHVLCEKPIATTAQDAQAMAEHALRARRVFFPGHNYKHAPVIKTVRSLLDSDAIGRVQLVSLQTFRTTHARGVSEWHPDWRREKRYSGGGIAMDHGSHTLYLAFEWLRSHPHTVSAKASTFGPYDTEDNLSCTLTFPNGLATAQLSWTAGARRVMYSLHGEHGAITVEDDRVELLLPEHVQSARPELAARVGVQSVPSHWMDASHKEWFGSLLDKLKQAIADDDFVGADALDAIWCIKTIAACYRSARLSSIELAIDQRESDIQSLRPYAAE
jgi:predicted dehydrogenase